MYVGLDSGSNSTYNLSGTGSLSASFENIGFHDGSSGHFVQSGGTNTVKDLYLSQYPGGQGTYLLSAGMISASEGVTISNGTFTQTGGTVTTGLLYLADSFANDVGAYVMSGGTLTLSPRASNSAFVVGINGSGTFTQNGGTITDTGTGNSGALILGYDSGSSGTYHLNGGTLSVLEVRHQQGQSTFDFNGGTLQAQADNASFMSGLMTAQVRDGGAKIDSNGHNLHTNPLNVNFARPFDISNSGGLTKLGQGTLTLTGNNTYTGGTFLNFGTLALGSTGAIAAGSNLTFGGGTLQFSPANTKDYTASIKNNTGTISIDTNFQDVTFAGALDNSNTGGLTKLGQGTLTLKGVNTYTGSTAVSAGTLAISGGSTGSLNTPLSVTGPASNNARVYLSGGTLLASNEVIGFRGSGTFYQNDGASTNTVAGTLYLGFFSSDTGIYVLGDGTLQAAQVTGASSTSVFNFQGGTLRAGASDNPADPTNPTTFFGGAFTANVRNATSYIDTNGFNVTVSSNLLHSTISGDYTQDGGLVKLGAGTLTLTGNNTYNGGTTVSAGTLQGNTASLQGNIQDDANLVFDQAADGTFAGTISGAGTLAKTGAGTLTLTGNNSYSGSTNVHARHHGRLDGQRQLRLRR